MMTNVIPSARSPMLGNLRISYKLLMMIGVSILGILAVAAVGLSALWNNLLEDRKAQLQDVVLMGDRRSILTIRLPARRDFPKRRLWSAARHCCANSDTARMTTSTPLTRKGWSWLTSRSQVFIKPLEYWRGNDRRRYARRRPDRLVVRPTTRPAPPQIRS